MRRTNISRITILATLFMFLQTSVHAQNSYLPGGGMNYFLYGVIAFVILSFSLAIYFLMMKNKYQKEAFLKTGKPHPASGLRKWWDELDKKYLTKAAPVEQEADVLLDHDYDGIKELDNALPPWWKWGFYITVVLAVIYMFRFHVVKSGPTPMQEYEKEMQIANEKLELYRQNNKESIDEKTITLADAAGIVEGKKIFTGTCTPCHGVNGEGNAVGPNLTDKYWLHGGSLGEVFHTITNGVPDKGMQAWGRTFSATDIRNLASYVETLQGTNPANAKAPQGTLFEPGKTNDTTVVKIDSLNTKPTTN